MKESNQERARVLLKTHRRKIDALDDRILKLLGQRFDVVREVAKIKAKHGIPAILPDRVIEVRELSVKRGCKYGINPTFIRRLYTAIIRQSCLMEDAIKGKLKKK